MGSVLLVVCEEMTLVAQVGRRKGELVLQSRPPPVTNEASDHTGRGPKRRTATIPSMPMADTASEKADSATDRWSSATATKWAQRVKCSLIASAREANRRSHPRTVDAGRPSARAMRRCPSPRALAVSAMAITSALSRRRTRVSSWTKTWVQEHDRQNDRRKRRRSVFSTKRTSRSIPYPHGRNPAPRFGQARWPFTRSASTAASSVPTMITAELRLRQEEPSRDRSNDLARGLLRVQLALTLPPRCPPRQDRRHRSRPRCPRRRQAGHQSVLRLHGARPPTGAQSARRSTLLPSAASIHWRRTEAPFSATAARMRALNASLSISSPS